MEQPRRDPNDPDTRSAVAGRTLEELENSDWGDPPADATRLVSEVYRLRRLPLGSFTIEDFRLMILQQVSLAVLVPMALAELHQNPLAEGDFFPGDLLSALLQLPDYYWDARPDELATVSKIVASIDVEDPEVVDSELDGELIEFMNKHRS